MSNLGAAAGVSGRLSAPATAVRSRPPPSSAAAAAARAVPRIRSVPGRCRAANAESLSFEPAPEHVALSGPASGARPALTKQRAREIMSVDPHAPNALDILGSKVDTRVRFQVHYSTRMGEAVFVVGSHERLGTWAGAYTRSHFSSTLAILSTV
jgi:hypothetical protein